MKAKRFCISTGSSPFVPPIEGLKETKYITNEEIFHLKKLPERLIVLGGGAIGIEMGQAFQRLGSKVSIVEMSDTNFVERRRRSFRIYDEIFGK